MGWVNNQHKERHTAPEGSERELTVKAEVLAARVMHVFRRRMNEQNINSSQLAEMIGTSPSFVSQLFSGSRFPSMKMMAKMQKALGLHLMITDRDHYQREMENARSALRAQIKLENIIDKLISSGSTRHTDNTRFYGQSKNKNVCEDKKLSQRASDVQNYRNFIEFSCRA